MSRSFPRAAGVSGKASSDRLLAPASRLRCSVRNGTVRGERGASSSISARRSACLSLCRGARRAPSRQAPLSVVSPLVFCTHEGRSQGANFKRYWQPVVKAAGLADFRFPDLRDTFALRLVVQRCVTARAVCGAPGRSRTCDPRIRSSRSRRLDWLCIPPSRNRRALRVAARWCTAVRAGAPSELHLR